MKNTDWKETIWHRWLNRPYRLSKVIDENSASSAQNTIVFLHGIASSADVWRRTIKHLEPTNARLVAFDLLGFGTSPKPRWISYSAEDHAKAIIAALRTHNINRCVLVGHSMGCLVAVQVAKQRPDLVSHLVLYEMPIYQGLPAKRRYAKRRDLYYLMYQKIVDMPELILMSRQALRNTVAKLSGFEISPQSWLPFTRSLKNTIVEQTTLDDMRHISTPTDVIYGSLDMLVIKGNPKKIFGNDHTNVKTHTITNIHAVTARASRFLAKHLRALLAAS